MSEQTPTEPGVKSATNFQYYRQQFENDQRQQSAEAEAIFEETVFQNVLADPRTVSLELDVDGQQRKLPLLTPLENIEWFNLDYHRRYTGNRPLWHFGHLSLQGANNYPTYLAALQPALQQLAEEEAVVVLDHNAAEALRIEHELGVLATASAVNFVPIDGPEGRYTTHFHYASLAEVTSKAHEPRQPRSLYETFSEEVAGGSFDGEAVTVKPILTTDEIEQIWAFYKPVFDELSANDPVAAGLTETEFRILMESPDCVKFLYRRDDQIINMCLLMNIKHAPWMNQYFYRQQFPNQFVQDRVYLSPGVITNPLYRGEAASLHTMGMVGKVIALSGAEIILTFACDTTSKDINKVPQLSYASLLRNGIRTNFSKDPISRQLFSMLAVTT